MDKAAKLLKKAKTLVDTPRADFLALANCLWLLHQADPKALSKLWNDKLLSRRRAIYLRDVGRLLADLDVPKHVVTRLGWTKLAVMIGRLNELKASSCADDLPIKIRVLFNYANQANVHKLRAHLKGAPDFGKQHCVLLYFDSDGYKAYQEAVIANGGKISDKGKGLVGQEQALLKIIAKASSVKKP